MGQIWENIGAVDYKPNIQGPASKGLDLNVKTIQGQKLTFLTICPQISVVLTPKQQP